jgi:hypothetical protein
MPHSLGILQQKIWQQNWQQKRLGRALGPETA